MKRTVLLRAAISVASLLFAARCEGASTLVFKAGPVEVRSGGAPHGRVHSGGRAVMTLGGHGSKSLGDAREVARRLNALAEQGLKPEEITARPSGSTWVISARGRRIVQVDRRIARVHLSTPDRLARVWSQNLRTEFGQPYLSLRPMVVPLGETRTATVYGNVVGTLRVKPDAVVVDASYEPKSNSVQVVGQQVGRTELLVSDERSLLRVPVRSAKYAARLTGPLSAAVTGQAAEPEVLSQAIEAAVAAGVAAEPGAWVSVRTWMAQVPASLPAGASASVAVRIAATGEDYLPYVVRQSVTVRNEKVEPGPAELLMVSNSPERLLGHGLWFEGTLKDLQSARLLYHHVNGTDSSGELVIELWNLGDDAARVHLTAGRGGPSTDESWAGHRAAVQFIDRRLSNTGWIVPVPPRMALPVFVHRVTPGATASGILALHALARSDLRVRLYFVSRRSERQPHTIRSYSPSPLLGMWQYPAPQREVHSRYVVGREWAFVTIGDQPIEGLADGDSLAGNYGVIYDIHLQLHNPTSETARVEILLEAAGGPARGVVLVDGSPAQAAMFGAIRESRVARFALAPGEERRVHIETMPQGGSSYPVRLVARAI